MSETEVVRDPLDVAADEVAELLAERKAGSVTWERLIESLAEKAQQAQRRYLLAQRLQAAFAAEGGQLPLFPGVVAGVVAEPPKPRAKRRVMMHAGELAVSFECPKCHETEPIPEGTNDSARKRGMPCPTCNGAAEQET